MNTRIYIIGLFSFLGLLSLINCNPCGAPVNPGRFEVANFEPINTKSNGFLNENDTTVVSLNDFAILLQFDFKQVAYSSPLSLFPMAQACSPADP